MSDALELTVFHYPDPVLRKVADPVPAFDDETSSLVQAMFLRMKESKGVGLAAPQVGIRKRILVLNPTGEPGDALALVNPTITSRSGPAVVFAEGCLSFPGIYAEVSRPERCAVKALDAAGKPIDREFDGFVGRIIQHEYDHLEGILLVDRMSPAEKLKHKAALDELVQKYKRGLGRASAQPAPARPS